MQPALQMADFTAEFLTSLDRISATQWNCITGTDYPFLRHEFLYGLEKTACTTAETGWQPCHLLLRVADTLVAVMPLYLKTHSYGEYVFDWSWADAHQRHGLRYYPKLLVAVPFTPVPGSRLMAVDETARGALLAAVHAMAHDNGLSSAHVLFHDAADAAVLSHARWLPRRSVQFHWSSALAGQPASFASFLAGMQREKRKKIAQERRKVTDAGVTFTVHQGAQIDGGLWQFFYNCYVATYLAHHSRPYLTRQFFDCMAESMPEHWVLFVAHAAGAPVATSLIAIDPKRRHAYGRYWGAVEFIDCLHFEACYYQPLQWCIEHGYVRFEGGAQGEHKMARGLLPVGTQSAHWLAHPAFANAIDQYLRSESQGVEAYVNELNERDPFRRSA